MHPAECLLQVPLSPNTTDQTEVSGKNKKYALHRRNGWAQCWHKKAMEELSTNYKVEQNTLHFNSKKPRDHRTLRDAFGMFPLLLLTRILAPHHQIKASGNY